MSTDSPDTGSMSHFNVYWPGYLWRFGGMIAALLVIATGLYSEIGVLVAIGVVLLLVFMVLTAVAIWSISRTSGTEGHDTVEALFQLSQTRSSDTLASIDLGFRWPAITLSQHLTSGRMVVIDIYNPQLMSASSLTRARQDAPHGIADPRVTWYDSELNLLPLPDDTVTAVFLYHVLSEVTQEGDRKALLEEINRILAPDGRLLIAELADTWPNRLRPGSGRSRVQPLHHWTNLLTEAGFELRRTLLFHGDTACIRVDKPSPYAGTQMSLDLEFKLS